MSFSGRRRSLGQVGCVRHVDCRELPHRSQVEGFVERPSVRSAVAEERHQNGPFSFEPAGQRGTGTYGYAGTDDPVGSQHAQLHVGDVHRTALTFAVPGCPAEDLGHHQVEVAAAGDQVAVPPVVLVTKSSSRRTAMTPAATASSPLYKVKEPRHVTRQERGARGVLEGSDLHHAPAEIEQVLTIHYQSTTSP